MKRVPIVSPLSRKHIETIAVEVLRQFQPDCLKTPTPVDLEFLLEFVLPANGYYPDIVDLGPSIEGLTDPKSRTVCLSPDVYDDMGNGDGRARFTVAHEIGHVILHAHEIRETMVNRGKDGLARRSDIKPYEDPEWQANAFAGSLLMPESAVREIVSRNTRKAVSAVANILRVSRAAADIRLRNLQLEE